MLTPEQLADRQAIVDLTLAYTWALDTRDFEALREVFLPEATAELASPLLDGVDAIIERVSAALSPLDASQHIVSNHWVTLDGDGATCRCQLQAQHVLRKTEGGANFIVGGHYDDSMVRTEDGWRIAHRTLVMVWTEGNPQVVRTRGAK